MIKFNNYQINDLLKSNQEVDQEVEQVDDQENEQKRVQTGRNSETFLLLCGLATIWILPFIRTAEAGGLGGYIMTWFGILSTVFGALILFFPLRLLVRHSLDEKKKIVPRILILILVGVVLVFSVPNLTPGYIKDMEFAAQEYYRSNPQEFSEATEGKIIEVDVMSGPYITYFIYTNSDAPEREKGGTVVDFENGWYFVGVFHPI